MLKMQSIIESLPRYEERFDVLTRRMAEPEVLSQPDQLRKTGKELRQLEAVIKAVKSYAQTLAQIDEARGIVRDGADAELVELAEAELPELEERRAGLEREIQLLLVPRDPNDEKNVILEIRAGTGGEEAALFAGDLLRMYKRYAERRGWKTEIVSMSDTGKGGIKEVFLRVAGDDVYSRLKFESGVHRVQRVPETEASGRIHTSAASVAVLPEADAVEVQISDADVRVDVYRSSGPGGQSVNTTDSAVRLTHVPTGLVVSCQDEKSQHKNKAKAFMVLRARLYDLEAHKQHAEQAAARRSQVSTGDRSAKIRTYNFPQARVTDHRIGLTLHRLPEILDGDLDALGDALALAHAQERLAEASQPEA